MYILVINSHQKYRHAQLDQGPLQYHQGLPRQQGYSDLVVLGRGRPTRVSPPAHYQHQRIHQSQHHYNTVEEELKKNQ